MYISRDCRVPAVPFVGVGGGGSKGSFWNDETYHATFSIMSRKVISADICILAHWPFQRVSPMGWPLWYSKALSLSALLAKFYHDHVVNTWDIQRPTFAVYYINSNFFADVFLFFCVIIMIDPQGPLEYILQYNIIRLQIHNKSYVSLIMLIM